MLKRTERAETLAQLAQTLQPEPLETRVELDAFYQAKIRGLRGVDRIGQMRISLEDARAVDMPFKAFLVGHPGVGKTTELSKLLLEMEGQFRPLRLSVTSELNPGTLRFYDVLLLMLIKIVEDASRPEVIGFVEHDLEEMLGWVREQLSTKWTKHLRVNEKEYGAGIQFPWLKLFGNIKQGATREQGQQEYELSLVSDLVELTNRVLNRCNELLKKHQAGRQWVIVVEDLEKVGLAPGVIKDLLIGLRPSLQELTANVIVTIPAWLNYSADAQFILPPNFQTFVVTDIAVYQKDHRKDDGAIAALREVVTSRANEALFEDGVVDRFCIASGGNMRDLFAMIRDAMLTARGQGAGVISMALAELAIASLRGRYKDSLGTMMQDDNSAGLEDKLRRLVEIYERKLPTAEVPDPIVYQLLRQRCLLQYNGVGWMGVHPLVVDLLIAFEKLKEGSPGGSAV